jgi:hypothetical protein
MTSSVTKIAILLLVAAMVALAYWGGLYRGRMAGGVIQVPSATEVFNLRSQCAKLGKEVEQANPASPVLTQSEVSHYDPRTNRCYVELYVGDGDPPVSGADTTPVQSFWFSRRLFDGQTGDMLAVVEVRPSKTRFAMIYMDGWRELATSLGWSELSPSRLANVPSPEFDFETVGAFIRRVMSDDRKQ